MAESMQARGRKGGAESVNFIHSIIEKDLEDNLYDRPIKTRFPAGTERLSSHRAREIHLSQFFYGREI